MDPDETGPAQEVVKVRRRRRWHSRLAKTVVGALLGLILVAGLGMVLLDTAPGHRFLADRIAALAPHSGLKIRVGRIESRPRRRGGPCAAGR